MSAKRLEANTLFLTYLSIFLIKHSTSNICYTYNKQQQQHLFKLQPQTEVKPISEQTKDEKPVFITTFKSVQNEDGETVIETENKKVTQEEGVLVEEVLSDTETIQDQDEQSPHKLEIVEVNDVTGTFLYLLYYS